MQRTQDDGLSETHTEEVLERLKLILVDLAGLALNPHEIDPELSILEEGLGLDSIMLVEFIALLEAEFGFTFAENDLNMDVFANLHALADFIVDQCSVAS
ncbi:MAG: acyl carrier protein [Methylococcales bacterium]